MSDDTRGFESIEDAADTQAINEASDAQPLDEATGTQPIDSGNRTERITVMNQGAGASAETPADAAETPGAGPQTEYAVPLYAAAQPMPVQPQGPSGPSVATIVFGIILIFVGLCGLASSLAYDAWMPDFMRMFNVTPQTVMAFGCGVIGVLLIVVALVWAIAKVIKKQ